MRISSSFFFICCIIGLIICSASAITPEIGQGDSVYMGEIVDISLAASWPDYKVAWCKSEGSYCSPPDQIIEITGNMHRYYIDPNKFNYGSYYRWSGEWSRGENLNAFVVKTGTRPNATEAKVIEESEPLIFGGNVSKIVQADDSTIVIARGDTGRFEYQNESVYGYGHLWFFGGDEYVNGGTHSELDLPTTNINNTYGYDFDTTVSNRLDYGNYTGYLQANGKNGFQDIFYIKDYKTPFNATYPILESIYKAVSSKDINGLYPEMIEDLFISMVTDPIYSDDIIVPITMQVVPPQIFIRDYYEENDTIFVKGVTSLNSDCTISAVVDPEHYPLAADLKENTHYANVTGDIHDWRKFSIELEVPWGELNIGMHEVKFTGTGYQNDLKAEQVLLFKVSDIYTMPTPTPLRERVIVEDYGWHRVTPTPSVTPTITTPIAASTTRINTGNISYDGNVTTIATANVTPTTIPSPKPTTTLVIPLNPIMGFLALAIAMIVLRRD